MTDDSGKPTDLRARRRREQRRLFWIVAVFLVVVGGIGIAVVYGPSAAGLGAVCLLSGASVLGLLWLVLYLFERLGKS